MADDDSDDETIVDQRIEFISNLVNKFWRLKSDKWSKMYSVDDNKKIFVSFFDKDINQLFVGLTTSGTLQIMTIYPSTTKGLVKIMYFFKKNPSEAIYIDSSLTDIKSALVYGEISADSIGFLKTFLDEVAMPLLLNGKNQTNWPKAVREDVTQHVFKLQRESSVFFASMKGETILPLPLDTPADDKEFGQLMDLDRSNDINQTIQLRKVLYAFETVVIEWVHQVEKVLKKESSTPLLEGLRINPYVEIEFWRNMQRNLEHIYEQLTGSKVRKMAELLERSHSVYFSAFKKLFTEVVKGLMEAQDIAMHLEPLRGCLEDMEMADFENCGRHFVPIFHMMCLIWAHCKHYQVPGRIVVLLKETCNLIIEMSHRFLSPEELFKGEVEDLVDKADLALQILKRFRTVYIDHRSRLASYFPDGATVVEWEFHHDLVFGHFDVYVGRLEIVVTLMQTCLEFLKLEKVEFGGRKGNIHSKQLQDIATDFAKSYKRFPESSYDPLDVENLEFEEDYKAFNEEIDILYKRLANIYSLAFADCSGLESVFKLIAIYSTLIARPYIQEAIEATLPKVVSLIDEEIDIIKEIFDEQMENGQKQGYYVVHKNMPSVSGALKWCQELRYRLTYPIEQLRFVQAKALDTIEGEQVVRKFEEMKELLSGFDGQVYSEWINGVDETCSFNMHQYLMIRKENGLLAVNFDPKLVAVLREVKYLEIKNAGDTVLSLPESATSIFAENDTLRRYVNNLDLIATWYNFVRQNVLNFEVALIEDSLTEIDGVLKRAEGEISWDSEGAWEYIQDLRQRIHKLYNKLVYSKENLERITQVMMELSKTPLYERKEAKYETLLNLDDRDDRLNKRYQEVESTGRTIHQLVETNRTLFEADANLPSWKVYLERVDEMIIDAFQKVVETSVEYLLQETALTEETQPLLESRMELQVPEVKFFPALDSGIPDSLYDLIDGVLSDTFRQGQFVDRVSTHLVSDEDSATFQAELEELEDLNMLRYELMNSRVVPAMRAACEYRDTFNKYAYLWTDDRREFLRQFLTYGHLVSLDEVEDLQETPPTLDQFREQIDHYEDIYVEIEKIKSTEVFHKWFRLDVRPFRQALLNVVKRWSYMFKEYLMDYVVNSLSELEDFVKITDNGLAYDLKEGDYDGLVGVMGHLQAQKERQQTTDEMFDPIKDTIDLLKSYGQDMPPEVYTQLEELPEKWSNTKKTAALIRQALAPLQNHEVANIRERATQFDAKQHEFRGQFKEMAAFNYAFSTPYREMDLWQQKLSAVETQMNELVDSAKLFEVNVPDFKLIKLSRRDLNLLKSLWDQIFIVRTSIEDWQTTPWMNIDVDQMDMDCKKFAKELRTLDSVVRQWNAYSGAETEVKNMLTSLRAVTELRNPAIRDRHWAQLMEATGVHFMMTEETTLAELLSLQLHRFEEDVRNIVDKAVKEASMEKVLRELEVTWQTMELEHETHARTGVTQIKVSEKVIETLEDNQAQLQNLLTSKHIGFFLTEVREWVVKLSTADQVINIYLEVQRTWVNLEAIFIGTQDIRKQLPEASQRFEAIDADFKGIVKDVAKSVNVIEATNQNNLFERLDAIKNDLSFCEKALMDYMETKRLAFPRFYFVSHNDLLDILSHGNQPVLVMVHLTKLFDSMAKLKFDDNPAPPPQSEDDRKIHNTVLAMWSKDGEYLDLNAHCILAGQVEYWLNSLLEAMRKTMRFNLEEAVAGYEEKPRDQWIFDFPAQVALTSSQIGWTTETNLAFQRLEEGFEHALREYNKKQIQQLNALINMLIGDLNPGDRQKIMTICTIDVHNRDVVSKLIAQKAENSQAFTWLSQLRHRWDEEKKECFANICDAEFRYYHEYLGNTSRLVITPLTDRCYITLTQSLHLFMSGAPAGPAGTGKTETTKDLGRALGMMVYVFNCSEQMDYKSIGNIYKGLAQSGAWGCFDEFNRIAVEVLSVVAVQVKCIQDALKVLSPENDRFQFLGEEICLASTVGIFITMNPGYAGRTELPENLKALFRPCAMVVPDIELICEIMLVAEGFIEARLLARKFITLYSLCKELLSKQYHYDWGLRAVRSVLTVAGSLKRSDPHRPEDQVLMRALRDFNVPKIVTNDVPVFMGLIGDLFPALDVPRKRDLDFEKAVKQASLDLKLQPEDNFILKVVQLEELFGVRHSVFIVGNAGTGKSQVWKTLHKTSQNAKKRPVAIDLNPKAVTNNELFGIINPSTREWKDGLFSMVMRDLANITHSGPKWIVLDGDIDPMWIESLNTVMDDNKVLTLASNERIPLTPTMRLLFEISHLRTATPATVSRAGILYINPGDLGWMPYMTSWINTREAQTEQANLLVLFDKYVPSCLEALRTKFKNITPIAEISHVQMLCYLLECLLTPQHGLNAAEASKDLYEIYFVFCSVWAFGGATFQDQIINYRLEFSRWFVTEFKTIKFPKDAETVFDVYIDPETHKFESWSKKVPKFELDPEIPLQATLVYTTETVRVRYLMDLLIEKRRPVMLVGGAGTGKSVLMQDKLNHLVEMSDDFLVTNVPFNYYTTSEMLQRVLEKPLEKKSGRNFGPPGTRRLIYFLDDMNMPEVDRYFTVQPHTLIRQHLDYNHWYDRQKLTAKEIHNTQYVACMNPTAGSFTINPRLQRHFCVLAMSFPEQDALYTIYSSILQQHLLHSGDFPPDAKKPFIIKELVETALLLHHKVTTTFLPTAIKFHYSFNLRDLSSIYQGLLFATPDCITSRLDLARLWLHECDRVYCDKLVDSEDVDKYRSLSKEIAKKQLGEWFPSGDEVLFRQPLLYCHYAHHIGDDKYLPVSSVSSITNILVEALDSYNEINSSMNLVLFADAVEHVLRISRILESPRGNALLVGVGGSGKQSLSRLAAFISSMEVFQITLRKGYGIVDLKADLGQLFVKSGQKGIGMVFLLTDAQVAEERFLVLVNDLLASGEIPDLFADDEIEEICGGVKNEVKGLGLLDTKDNCWRFFIDRVRRLLKVVLCFSPVGNTLRVRARRFPALVNCTSIDMFHEWPEQALFSVSRNFLEDVPLLTPEQRDSTARFMAFALKSVNELSSTYLLNDRRYNYTTPKSFLEQISLYHNLLSAKHSELLANIDRLENGLKKLESTAEQVDELKAKLAQQNEEVIRREDDANKLLAVVAKDTERVSAEKRVADAEEEKVAKIQEEVSRKRNDCFEDLARAEPALEAAQKALNTLNKENLTEMKSFTQPPTSVVNVMGAVICLMASNGKLPRDRSWKACKVAMGRVDVFLESLIAYDKDNIHDNCLRGTRDYISKDGFDPDSVRHKSVAAAGICAWVINIMRYNEVYREVKPKRDALATAESELKAASDKLTNIRNKVAELESSLARLTADFERASQEKLKVQQEAETTAKTIELANRLVSGLASENDRWAKQVESLHKQELSLPGDVLITAGFISYVGYFTKQYRNELVHNLWLPFLENQQQFAISENLDPIRMLVDDAVVAAWNNEGLPSDRMSVENATILTVCERWPLLVDPQLQGVKWIKNKYDADLKVVHLGEKKMMDAIELAISSGDVVLIENIGETIDPVLDPLLGRNTIKKGRAIRLGDKEIDYNPSFRLLLHTKLANPHYKPEMQAQTTLINFTVTRDGLEDQLLAAVVQKEKPELEELKSELTRQQNEFKITLKTLEDALLARLSAAEGNFLGDYALVENLENNKATAIDIERKVEEALVTEQRINEARDRFRICAARASLIFFIMNDLYKINPMYQFSLKAFSVVFEKAIDRAPAAEEEPERVANLMDSITHSISMYTARGLFEKDKLIFSTQMTFQILMMHGDINEDELDFLLRFPVVANVSSPVDFLTTIGWGGVKALVAMESGEFKNLDNDIVGSAKRWKKFVESECPEREKFPQEWKNKSFLQRLCMLRALRPDRMTYGMKDFIAAHLGEKYVEGRQMEFSKSYEESGPNTPIFFILSPGVDPLKEVESLGKKLGFTASERNFHNISLGQGQEIVAETALTLAAKEGHWVVLQNVHLVAKWLPSLESRLDELGEEANANYRVFISAEPAATAESHIIPQGILESSIKITNEPPTGMHANLHKAFALFDQETLEKCSRQVEFTTILFALCYFHAVVSERRKFGAIGWNRSYPFNNGDLVISVDVLYNYLEANPKVPWEDLRYLFGEIMYGGHITDDWDRELCRSYLEEYMRPDLLEGELDLAPNFPIPPTMDYKSYQSYIDEMLPPETPYLYGLHPNAEIEFLTSTANDLFRTVFEMQPRESGGEGGGASAREEKIRTVLEDLVERMPEGFNMTELYAKIPAEERTPFVVVAMQECERMNGLIDEMRRSLKELELGLKGELTFSGEMEALSQALFLDSLPETWTKRAYPSLHPLGLWYSDLQARVRELDSWVSDFTLPGSVWLGGLFNPQSFLTAVMQQMARKNEWPLDRMVIQVDVTKKQREDVGGPPREGAYIHGLYMEGAQWDHMQGVSEANLMDLHPALPIMFVRAIPVDRQDIRNAYACPVYKTKERGPTFVWTFNLKTKARPSRWILAGVALLLQV